MWMEKTEQSLHSRRVGFEGATFFNSKTGVTFQELLAKFSLDNNETLTRIGAFVHYLDTGRFAGPKRREWKL